MEQTLSIFPLCLPLRQILSSSSPRSATPQPHHHATRTLTLVPSQPQSLDSYYFYSCSPFFWQPGPLAHSALSLLPECECIRGELGSVMSVVLCPCPLHVSFFIVCLFVESLALVGAVGGLPPAPPPRTILVNTQTPSRLR